VLILGTTTLGHKRGMKKTIRLTQTSGTETVVVLDKIVRISEKHSNFNNDVYAVVHTMDGNQVAVKESMDEVEGLMSGKKRNKIVHEQYLMKEIIE